MPNLPEHFSRRTSLPARNFRRPPPSSPTRCVCFLARSPNFYPHACFSPRVFLCGFTGQEPGAAAAVSQSGLGAAVKAPQASRGAQRAGGRNSVLVRGKSSREAGGWRSCAGRERQEERRVRRRPAAASVVGGSQVLKDVLTTYAAISPLAPRRPGHRRAVLVSRIPGGTGRICSLPSGAGLAQAARINKPPPPRKRRA